jgi:hypothetical protein
MPSRQRGPSSSAEFPVMAGGGLSWTSLGYGLALDGAYLLAAVVIFDRFFHSALARGLLVKLE